MFVATVHIYQHERHVRYTGSVALPTPSLPLSILVKSNSMADSPLQPTPSLLAPTTPVAANIEEILQGTKPQTLPGKQLTRIFNYQMDQARTAAKVAKASQRQEIIKVEAKQGGNYYITFSAGAYLLFHQGMVKLRTQPTNKIIISTKTDVDANKQPVEDVMRFIGNEGPTRGHPMFTLNLYHTTCAALINGKNSNAFINKILPQLKQQTAHNIPFINALDKAIKAEMKKLK